MATQNEFTCPQGHSFSAVAKLRARCPTCGQMARMDFTKKVTKGLSATPSTSSPTSHKVVTRKDTTSGSQPVTILKTVKQSESGIKSTQEPVKSPESKKPIVVRQGLKRQMPKRVARPVSKLPEPKTKSPVKRVIARRGLAPTVTRPPKGSRERKVIQQTSEEPFWVQAKRKYFG